jgi:hypothetical protein
VAAASLFGFVIGRLFTGWIVGFAVALFLGLVMSDNTPTAVAYGIFLIPRFALWAFFIRWWYEPNGGTKALVRWSLIGTAVSSAVDLGIYLVYTHYDDVSWLKIPFC